MSSHENHRTLVLVLIITPDGWISIPEYFLTNKPDIRHDADSLQFLIPEGKNQWEGLGTLAIKPRAAKSVEHLGIEQKDLLHVGAIDFFLPTNPEEHDEGVCDYSLHIYTANAVRTTPINGQWYNHQIPIETIRKDFQVFLCRILSGETGVYGEIRLPEETGQPEREEASA
jgi:hypothetical protein